MVGVCVREICYTLILIYRQKNKKYGAVVNMMTTATQSSTSSIQASRIAGITSIRIQENRNMTREGAVIWLQLHINNIHTYIQIYVCVLTDQILYKHLSTEETRLAQSCHNVQQCAQSHQQLHTDTYLSLRTGQLHQTTCTRQLVPPYLQATATLV